MITYLLIGLAHAFLNIIFGIYVSKSFKNEEEFYIGFCVGLILTIIIWPITDLATIYLYIIKMNKK